MRLNILMLILVLLSMQVIATRITISSVQSKEVEPGQITEIIISLENQGDNDIEEVSVSLDLLTNQLPFAPVGSASQKIIDEIKEDSQKSVRFQLLAQPEAKPGIYKIPLIIKYNDIEDITVISLKVNAQPELEVAIEELNIYKVGDSGEIIIRFVNKGLTDIKFLTAELLESQDYNILSASSFYVGNVEPDDFETITFNIHLNNRILFLPIKIQYKDQENNLYTQTKLLDITIYSEEDAKKLGLTKPNYTTIIITIVIILIILLFVIRTIRKKRRLKKLGIT